ncbi:MAG: diaminopimelate decarboxylase [Bacteroidales bacterium]|nr:diaminopimelate decarboxylase [Bacteroidales bacterium]
MIPQNLIHKLPKLQTPLYFYDMELLQQTLDSAAKASRHFGYHIHYALKANFNVKILESISATGMGADCVSGNEIIKALQSGFHPGKIVFAGVGKSDEEIRLALEKDIFAFNCESLQEIEVVNEIAASLGKKARIFLRLNPDIEAHTHKNITTGTAETKFGISPLETELYLKQQEHFNHTELIGLHFHIGSQICDFDVFRELSLKVNEIQDHFEANGIQIQHLNMGGGLGIDYKNPTQNTIPDFKGYFETFHQHLKLRPGQQVHFELGRALVAQCGVLLSRVLYIKSGEHNRFAIIDASMTDLLRPALYEAYHKIENLNNNGNTDAVFDVAGPVCESSDVFARNIPLGKTVRGDILAIYSTGAYGQVMSSAYNLRSPARTLYSDEME